MDMFMEDYGVSARLVNEEAWKMLHQVRNEMILTKKGRNMFPRLEYCIFGLNPSTSYSMFLHMETVDLFRRRYVNGKWEVGCAAPTPMISKRVKTDNENALTGDEWMKKGVSFSHIKLTNLKDCKSDSIIPLGSMHMYIPVLEIHQNFHNTVDFLPSPHTLVRRITFCYTSFIAVTAYQNTEIKEMKIRQNPFAKAFRVEATMPSSKKRKRLNSEPDSDNGSMVSLTESQWASTPKLPKMMSHVEQETPFFSGFYPGCPPGDFNYMTPYMPNYANLQMGGNTNNSSPPGMNMCSYPNYSMVPMGENMNYQLLQYPYTSINSMNPMNSMMYSEYTALQ